MENISKKETAGKEELLSKRQMNKLFITAIKQGDIASFNTYVDQVDKKFVDRALMEAISVKGENSDTIFNCLMERKPDVNQRGNMGFTPLLECVISGNSKRLEVLLKAGAEPNSIVENFGGVTPLMMATRYCNVKEVELLVNAGANSQITDKQGKSAQDSATAMMLACKPEDEERRNKIEGIIHMFSSQQTVMKVETPKLDADSDQKTTDTGYYQGEELARGSVLLRDVVNSKELLKEASKIVESSKKKNQAEREHNALLEVERSKDFTVKVRHLFRFPSLGKYDDIHMKIVDLDTKREVEKFVKAYVGISIDTRQRALKPETQADITHGVGLIWAVKEGNTKKVNSVLKKRNKQEEGVTIVGAKCLLFAAILADEMGNENLSERLISTGFVRDIFSHMGDEYLSHQGKMKDLVANYVKYQEKEAPKQETRVQSTAQVANGGRAYAGLGS